MGGTPRIRDKRCSLVRWNLMATPIGHLLRLARAGFVLAQHGASLVPKGIPVPLPLRIARVATMPIRAMTWPFRKAQPKDKRLSQAITALGPSYIKLGQFLATRGDLIGPELQRDLSALQDRLPPFSMVEARKAVEESLGGKLEDHFLDFGLPLAAASIAQVHKAIVEDKDGTQRTVAVKILRPGVEARFKRDLDAWRFGASLIEKLHPPMRRLKPVAVVDNLARTTQLEMDLRLEAAALSEMADNTKGDKGFRVPTIDWQRTSRRMLTIEWIDGTPIKDRARLIAAGHDLKALGLNVIRSFLNHAMRDGFFHGDMHQGNLFVDKDGTLVAVDFGIVGRLGVMERRYLAEILHGLITRDYLRTAQMHFDAGYVPPHQSVEVFAQAMRAIGEPIFGRTAEEISMADLLGQLFAYTEVFDMETRPELILLQKSMVIVEGVARGLDPSLNMWVAAEPVAKAWLEANLGLAGRLRGAGEGAETLGRVFAELPRVLAQAERTALAFADTAKNGWRLDNDTVQRLAKAERRGRRWQTAALWVIALALAGMAAQSWW
jgi:ubiquinone biosynthesis protein